MLLCNLYVIYRQNSFAPLPIKFLGAVPKIFWVLVPKKKGVLVGQVFTPQNPPELGSTCP